MNASHTEPIVCDMTRVPDTDAERMDEYRRVFTRSLVAREKTVAGFRFRFRDEDGVESWVRDLAAREQTCCSFFAFTVNRVGGEVLLDGAVIDDDGARGVMEEFYELPATLADPEITAEQIEDRFLRSGLHAVRRVPRE